MAKIKDFSGQLLTFYEYLKGHVATTAMAAKATQIYLPNACRYKRTLEKAGRLFIVRHDACQVTGAQAAYLTADRSLVDNGHQLSFISDEAKS